MVVCLNGPIILPPLHDMASTLLKGWKCLGKSSPITQLLTHTISKVKTESYCKWDILWGCLYCASLSLTLHNRYYPVNAIQKGRKLFQNEKGLLEVAQWFLQQIFCLNHSLSSIHFCFSAPFQHLFELYRVKTYIFFDRIIISNNLFLHVNF